ncbi:methyltransferase domain-containing protein, partial [Magnaporthiopsis poae ATCC 64411]
MATSQLHESQNVYDNDDTFWGQYSQFPRMRQGLAGASEWPLFRPMWPNPAGLRVLDLGCGDSILGCYAAAQGASRVLGVDLSERMLERAEQNAAELVSAAAANGNTLTCGRPTFGRQDLEDLRLDGETFDLVVSGLALHYVADFKTLAERVFAALSPGGCFVFSVEHPMLTAPVKPGFLKHSDRVLKAAENDNKAKELKALPDKSTTTTTKLPSRSA